MPDITPQALDPSDRGRCVVRGKFRAEDHQDDHGEGGAGKHIRLQRQYPRVKPAGIHDHDGG